MDSKMTQDGEKWKLKNWDHIWFLSFWYSFIWAVRTSMKWLRWWEKWPDQKIRPTLRCTALATWAGAAKDIADPQPPGTFLDYKQFHQWSMIFTLIRPMGLITFAPPFLEQSPGTIAYFRWVCEIFSIIYWKSLRNAAVVIIMRLYLLGALIWYIFCLGRKAVQPTWVYLGLAGIVFHEPGESEQMPQHGRFNSELWF